MFTRSKVETGGIFGDKCMVFKKGGGCIACCECRVFVGKREWVEQQLAEPTSNNEDRLHSHTAASTSAAAKRCALACCEHACFDGTLHPNNVPLASGPPEA